MSITGIFELRGTRLLLCLAKMLVAASQSVWLFKGTAHLYFDVLIVSACEFWKEAVENVFSGL